MANVEAKFISKGFSLSLSIFLSISLKKANNLIDKIHTEINNINEANIFKTFRDCDPLLILKITEQKAIKNPQKLKYSLL
jgi:hypothetical protein